MKKVVALESVKNGNIQLIETIKLLLYKLDSEIFDVLDFDDDDIYANPLLFAFFNSEKVDKEILLPIILTNLKKKITKVKVHSDNFGRIYLPHIGWLLTEQRKSEYELIWEESSMKLRKNGLIHPHILEPIEYIAGTRIELLKYPVPLLDQCYYDVDGNLIDVEIEMITNKHRDNLRRAFDLIRQFAPEHFKLIESVTRQVVMFNVDTFLRNSFATPVAHGVGFFNVCQESYNEVFFVDDIAHQTGHIIFSALISDFEDYVKVEKELVLEIIPLPDRPAETRNVHIIFHALYTYYTTFLCLDACLSAGTFDGHKKHEALGRIGFYLRKCFHDLNLIEKPVNAAHSPNFLFTEKGLAIYNMIKEKYISTLKKYGTVIKPFNLDNQPYNFNYSIFLESNPFDETN